MRWSRIEESKILTKVYLFFEISPTISNLYSFMLLYSSEILLFAAKLQNDFIWIFLFSLWNQMLNFIYNWVKTANNCIFITKWSKATTVITAQTAGEIKLATALINTKKTISPTKIKINLHQKAIINRGKDQDHIKKIKIAKNIKITKLNTSNKEKIKMTRRRNLQSLNTKKNLSIKRRPLNLKAVLKVNYTAVASPINASKVLKIFQFYPSKKSSRNSVNAII
jgi:hypothetical protein